MWCQALYVIMKMVCKPQMIQAVHEVLLVSLTPSARLVCLRAQTAQWCTT